MADFTQFYGYGRDGFQNRRTSAPHNQGYGASVEQRLAERAQEYDRALKQSQNAAMRRRGNAARTGIAVGEGPSYRAAAERMAGTATAVGARAEAGVPNMDAMY